MNNNDNNNNSNDNNNNNDECPSPINVKRYILILTEDLSWNDSIDIG